MSCFGRTLILREWIILPPHECRDEQLLSPDSIGTLPKGHIVLLVGMAALLGQNQATLRICGRWGILHHVQDVLETLLPIFFPTDPNLWALCTPSTACGILIPSGMLRVLPWPCESQE